MRPPTTLELLDVWEIGGQQALLNKSIQLLAICSGTSPSHIASLSIGERDARLLQLREWLFGSRLLNKTNCPQCNEPIEWENTLSDLRLQSPGMDEVREFTTSVDGFSIRFRLPNSQDIYQATTQADSAASRLLRDCILELRHNEAPYTDPLPDIVIDTLNQRMETEDPQANIDMRVNCPVCAHQWTVRFDILSYLWMEIDSWAHHIFQDVYVLARAFGWSEQDILRMSPQRRQRYLDMVRL